MKNKIPEWIEITCDFCGKKYEADNVRGEFAIMERWKSNVGICEKHAECDLCETCFSKLDDFIEELKKRGKTHPRKS
jgi:hypothetical protein